MSELQEIAHAARRVPGCTETQDQVGGFGALQPPATISKTSPNFRFAGLFRI
jgi:hypothetical protein